MFWLLTPGLTIQVLQGLLCMASHTIATLFQGYMELVMMTNSRPAKGGRFPEKTFKRRNVGFPISLFSS